ncbi:MAG TPA: TonB family protein [Xanthomonadaceae bacterium]|jgi:protein TonB|nr:TonB family protein [Xanthomonadaceae bacterium]
MVRSASFPQQSQQRPDPVRVAAISASIAANIALFLFLMQPLVYSPPTEKPDTSDFKMVDVIKPKPVVVITRKEPIKPSPQVIRVPQKTQVIRPVDPPPVITRDAGPIDPPMQPPQITKPGDDDTIGPPLTVSTTLSPIASPAPNYPIDAVRDGITGTVQLELLVGVDGHVIEARIVRSSGDRRLDTAARDQVLHNWRFAPALQNGVAVQALGRLPVVFTLDRQ